MSGLNTKITSGAPYKKDIQGHLAISLYLPLFALCVQCVWWKLSKINQTMTCLWNSEPGLSKSFILIKNSRFYRQKTKKKNTTVQTRCNIPRTTHLFYPGDIVHCQFFQRALQLFVIGCCCFVNNLFLSAGGPLREEQG